MAWIAAAFAALMLGGAEPAGTGAKETMRCDTGPLKRTYGDTPWLVYSCVDGKTLVIVSDNGNPAMPFVFMLFPKEGAYALYGEGNGDKSVTSRVHGELKALTVEQILGLIAETQRVGTSGG